MTDSAELLDNIKTRMKAQGWTQQEIAQRMGILQPNLASILNGRRSPTLNSLTALVDAVECDLIIVSKRKAKNHEA